MIATKLNGLLILACLLCSNNAFAAAAVFCDLSDSTSMFAAREVKDALIEKGNTVGAIASASSLIGGTEAVRVVLAKKDNATVESALASEQGSAVGTLQLQGYAWRKTVSSTTTTYWVIGGDGPGVMYGGLALAEAIETSNLSSFANSEHSPYIEFRGFKYDCPLDCRTPAYGDAGDAQQNNIETNWDMNFWTEFLDDLARNHFNVIYLWTQHPFPNLVKVPEYPNAALSDVKRATVPIGGSILQGTNMTPANMLSSAQTVKVMSIDEKIAFWKKVMAYAHDRGIRFNIMTYVIHIYSLEGKYGITASMTNATTKDYYRKTIRTLFLTYPLLEGIGLLPGETVITNDATGRAWIWDTYGQGILDAKNDPSWQSGRKVRFTFRTPSTNDIAGEYSAFSSYPDEFDLGIKYTAHMYSSLKPVVALPFFSSIPSGKKAFVETRNESIFMMRFGDREFIRAYIQNLPQSTGKLAGFLWGSNDYQYGREFISTEPDAPRQLLVKKMWYNFMLLGRLGYDPTLPASLFLKVLSNRFPEVNSVSLSDAWASASRTIPMVTRSIWSLCSNDYMWYPEACYSNPHYGGGTNYGFLTISKFASASPHGPNMMSISTYCDRVTSGQVIGADTTPVQVAQFLTNCATAALRGVENLNPGANKELRLTIGDIKAMSHLGNYYAEKILGATDKALYDRNNATYGSYKNSAISHLQSAAAHWRKYATVCQGQYNPQILSRMDTIPINLKKFMTNVLADISMAGGSASQLSVQPTAGGAIVEAEMAQFQGGVAQTSISGFTGTGYVAVNATNASLQWVYTAPKTGAYLLDFRYAIGSGDVIATLTANGSVAAAPLSFWTTGNSWQTETRTVTLGAGSNTIVLAFATPGVSIDHVNILSDPSTSSQVQPIAVPAKSFSMTNGVLRARVILSEPTTISISLFTTHGSLVRIFSQQAQRAGQHLISANIRGVSAGFYIARLSYGNQALARKIMIADPL